MVSEMDVEVGMGSSTSSSDDDGGDDSREGGEYSGEGDSEEGEYAQSHQPRLRLPSSDHGTSSTSSLDESHL